MGARYSAWIQIGGSLARSQAEKLIKAIRADHARLDWGEPPFEPTTADELVAGQSEERWRLCDEEARYGEFDAIEAACRTLGLSYRRQTEAWVGEDAILIDWRPGMAEPLVRQASNEGGGVAVVPEPAVRQALTALEAGHTADAMAALRALCHDAPDLLPFTLT